MTPKLSPLELEEFVILQQHLQFILPNEPVADVATLFGQYAIDLDLGVLPGEPGNYQVRMKAWVNYIETPLAGYKIFIETAGIFKIDEKMPDRKLFQNLLYRSTLSMQLSYLRTVLAEITSHYPMGRYWLPSIDLVDLIEQKSRQQGGTKTKAKKSSASKPNLK